MLKSVYLSLMSDFGIKFSLLVKFEEMKESKVSNIKRRILTLPDKLPVKLFPQVEPVLVKQNTEFAKKWPQIRQLKHIGTMINNQRRQFDVMKNRTNKEVQKRQD